MYIKEQSRAEIEKLVANFIANKPSLAKVPEAQIEETYIRKMFHWLNWNTDNAGLPVSEWEFILQATDEQGKRPDCKLRLAGRDLTLLDAKRGVDNLHVPEWMWQVYKYGYSTQNQPAPRKVDFAILTNFQQFVVLDCTLYVHNPKIVSNLIVIDWTCDDFVNQFDTLWELFERENMRAAAGTRNTEHARGLWSLYLSPKKVKANRIPPDKAFLLDMDDDETGWRVRLAKDIKRLNPAAEGELITAAVQLLIDRLIFIKALSDREIEADYLAQLAEKVEQSGLAADDTGWFKACRATFDKLNQFYNGSIFEPRPELEAVAVSNKVVRDVIRSLQPENSPYNFAVMPVEILGTIYERFLGRVVRATDHRVKIEDKPEVRKAGGVYYTPQYIVDYMVQNTVGRLLEQYRTPEQVAKLKILDPACGSGSFLLGAYQALIDWHKRYYAEKTRLDKTDREIAYYTGNHEIRLTAKLKRQILLNNIYGVDIDPQAVEVTRFSLSLKAMEDTRRDELYQEVTLFKQTVLPDLRHNIKCGNSLVGNDYSLMLSDRLAVRAFEWDSEFAAIMANGGFDAVIGNPPWVSAWTGDERVRNYLCHKDDRLIGHWDTYLAFLAQTLKLIGPNGRHAFVYPTSILTEPYAKAMRASLINNQNLSLVAVFGTERVFSKVSRKVCILMASRATHTRIDQWESGQVLETREVEPTLWLSNHNCMINVNVSEQAGRIRQKILARSLRVGNVYYVNYGAQISSKEKGAFSQDRLLGKTRTGNAKKCLRGASVKRYALTWEGMFLNYQPEIMYGPRHPDFFESPKIIVNKTSGKGFKLMATLDDEGYYCDQRLIGLVRYKHLAASRLQLDFSGFEKIERAESEFFHLGLLNSKLLTYWFINFVATKNLQGDYTDVLPKMVRDLPLCAVDLANSDSRARHDQLAQWVKDMLDVHERKAKARTQNEQDNCQQQLESIDHEIDLLVYDLYDLTKDEIATVEGKK